jgi:hypothetical protein
MTLPYACYHKNIMSKTLTVKAIESLEPGQNQKFDEPGIDRFKCVRGLPDGFQLVIR